MTDLPKINMNPAKVAISGEQRNSFVDFAKKIAKETRSSICFGNPNDPTKPGENIELRPGTVSVFLQLQCERLGTPEEFGAIFGLIIESALNAGIDISFIKEVATAFSIFTPAIPEDLDDVGENDEIKAFLSGDYRVQFEKVSKQLYQTEQ